MSKRKGKKGGGKKKSAATDDGSEEASWDDMIKRLRLYVSKEKIDQKNADDHPLMQRFEFYGEEAVEREPKQLVLSMLLKPILVKAVCQTMIDMKWSKISSLCLWNTNCGDEGAEHVAMALPDMPSIKKLEMLDCSIGPKGCFYLGEAFSTGKLNLTVLRLDHNPITGTGVKFISDGLKEAQAQGHAQDVGKLSLLSLAYCDIGWDGGIHLCDIISLKQNSIKSANFEGNDLGSEGMTALAVGIAHADCLTTLNIAQNKFSDDLKMIDALARAFHRNKTLAHINIDGNLIGNDGCKYFVEFLNECTHILSFDITPFVGPIHFFALTEWLGRNKPKKGKKGGKKKKKKGK